MEREERGMERGWKEERNINDEKGRLGIEREERKERD